MAKRAIDRDQQEPLWLGIDLGTQSVRAMVVTAKGNVVGQGISPLQSMRDGPRHEQKPDAWWNAVCLACRSALSQLPERVIHGVAVDSTSGTILLADHRGRPITSGLMYDDARASAEIQRVNEVGAEIWAASGYRMQTSWALPKLLWLLHHVKGTTHGIRLMHQTDYINRQLTGHDVPTDMSTVLKTGYDLLNEQWPHQTLATLGIPEEILPDVVRSGVQIGTICAEASATTGIPTGTPLITGMTDGCAAQIGAGALHVGSWNVVLGTTLVLKGVTQDLLRDPAGVVYSHRSPDGHWLPGGASSTGAGILNTYFANRNLDDLGQQATQKSLTDIITYPLASQGERFPFVAPNAKGFILGTPHDEGELYTALLQGVAFVERLCFDYLDLLGVPTHGEVRMTGGGTRSRYWNQLRADVLARPVTIPDKAEAALGMAILAAAVERPLAQVAAEMTHIHEVIEPRAEQGSPLHEKYLRLVDEFVRRGWVQNNLAEHARKRVTG